MERAVIVRGQLTGKRRIDLDEPIEELSGPVEVTVRPVALRAEAKEDVLDFLARIPPGTRTKDEIDRCLQEERDSWERPGGWPWRRKQ